MLIGSAIQIYPFDFKPSAPPSGSFLLYAKTDDVIYLQDSAGNEYPFGATTAITSLVGEATGTGPGAATVTLSNSAVVGKLLTGFVAGPNSGVLATDSILGALQKLQAQISGTSGAAITALNGDVSALGPGSATATVNSVGGLSATLVAAGATLANAATSLNTGNDIVKRDNSGNFSAGTISAALIGNVTGNVSGSAASFTGNLAGDVTGAQGSTSIAPSVVTGKLLTGYTTGTNTVILATDTILQALEKLQAQVSATTSAAVTSVTASAPLSSSGGLTPNITISQSGALSDGYLSSVDWNTFNNKQSTSYTPTTPADWFAGAPSTIQAALDDIAANQLAPAYTEFHVNPGYTGTVMTGAYNQPYTTVQAAVNAAQALGVANCAVILHGAGTTENVTVNNYNSNLLIANATGTVVDNQVFTLSGTMTISGLSTRIRLKDFKIVGPGGSTPDLTDSSQGRNYFSNMDFGSGGGISYTGSWAHWHEYTDCTINGPISIAGTPSAGSQVSMWRTRGAPNITLNSSNVSLALYDNFSMGSITQTAGALTIDGGRGFASGSTIVSTTNNSSDVLEIINVSLNISGTTFAQINKTGTAPYVLSNVWRNEAGDVLTGTRLVQGASATDEKYVPGTPANWPTPPTSVAQALDDLAAANDLVPFVGDTGSGGVQGLVPAPPARSKAAGDFLSASGSWAYVDQSNPIYNPFSFIGITQWTGSTASKFENIATYTGIDGHKQYAAIVAGGSAGTIFIWDITDPAIPVLCSYMALAGAYNISIAQISGAIYAFVPSSGSSVLYTINVTNPYSISTTSSLTISGTPGSLYNCAYSNGYVYIATQNKGLTVVDVGGGLAGGTITVPVQSFQEGGTTNKTGGVAVLGNIVYTTNYQTTFPATIRYLKTWQLAAGGGTLAVPYLANTYTISGGPTGTSTKPLGVALSPSGNTAYVTDGNQNIIDIIDVTSPTSPNYLNYVTPSYTLADNTLGVAIVTATPTGNYLYVPSGSNATNGGCVDLFDVTTPSSPIKVKSIYTGVANDVFGGISLNSGYIFGADYGTSGGYSGISVFSQAFLNPTFGLPVTSNIQVEQLTPNTALVANGSQQLASSTTTAAELAYVHGVTSPLQTQINNLVTSSILNALIFG